MNKQELIHMHGLFAEMVEYIEAETAGNVDLDDYEGLGVRPTSIHKSKTHHKAAVYALANGITDEIEALEVEALDDDRLGDTAGRRTPDVDADQYPEKVKTTVDKLQVQYEEDTTTAVVEELYNGQTLTEVSKHVDGVNTLEVATIREILEDEGLARQAADKTYRVNPFVPAYSAEADPNEYLNGTEDY